MQPARVSDSAGARHSFEWDAASYNSPAIKALYGQARQMLQALQQSAYRWRFEAALSYERDALGRITGQTQTGPTGQRQHHYEYDSAGRLTKHTQQEDQRPGQSTEWRYDANGNRTHENGQLIARYDSQDRLLQWKNNTYAYSEAGDLQEKTTPQGATRYAYDSLGNLRLVTLPDGAQIEYLIDPLNRRIGKKKNGQLQYGLIYQDSLRPIADTDENGQLKSIYLYADKGNVPTAMLRADKSYLIISDHLGSVRQVIDTQTGEIAQQLDYDAWGQVTEDSRPGFQPFGFAGGLHDPDTQLTRFGARDYDAETGRWTAKDPILFDGGDSNLYGYVLQDPVNLIDRSGASPEDTQKIVDTFNQAIMDMNANRQRLPTAGRIGGIVNNQFSVASRLFDFPSEWTGYNTYDCYDQWKYVQERLNELKPTLTDQWSFNDYPTFGHMSGEAVSNNPNDRKIRMDPWRNYIRIK